MDRHIKDYLTEEIRILKNTINSRDKEIFEQRQIILSNAKASRIQQDVILKQSETIRKMKSRDFTAKEFAEYGI